MRDQRLGIELALGNELQRFLATATVKAIDCLKSNSYRTYQA